ncbi:DUF2799 domain-containing protein [Brenneria rubrifaciens]|uniref:DUF2799 domain-containing protein n=1 Tax=Brenneria rubrifaciens TaxID=55213 RepID=A0A4P8QL12_9GAMM|nr:DUF2799 domain-containing protein [Brenneria rubrifaciens]QCR07772.1 DUF2799 domain-containing protein [Brenneria rubrifaciens]
MKYSYFLAVILFMVGCQSNRPSLPPREETVFWYHAGYNDAVSGMVVKDNGTLQEWFGNPEVDRDAYLRGYSVGQTALCHTENMIKWGRAGKNFPASCDGAADAEQLRTQWRQSME